MDEHSNSLLIANSRLLFWSVMQNLSCVSMFEKSERLVLLTSCLRCFDVSHKSVCGDMQLLLVGFNLSWENSKSHADHPL